MEEIHRYTLVDLLENESFIAFINHPSAEDEAHWTSLLQEGQINAEDYELAAYCIRSFNPDARSLTGEESAQLWANIQQEKRRRKVIRLHPLLFLRRSIAAASVLLLTGLFLTQYLKEDKQPTACLLNIEDVALPEEKTEDIQIISSSDNRMSLKEKNADIVYNNKGEAAVNSQIVTQAKSSAREDAPAAIDYSQIIVPSGRHVLLTLSDGTKVWMNASSRVVYPSVFSNAGTREIFIEGEAYIEVSPDKNRPFVVKTNQMEVLALGTAFNVTAYNDEVSQTVVLVNGLVSIQTKVEGSQPSALSPNQLFRLTGAETLLKDVKVEQYISWKDGIYVYHDEPLSLILKRLAHYYGIAVEYTPEAGDMRFTGKLDLKEDAGRVLRGFSNTAPVTCREESDTYYFSTNLKPR
ncbi:MAG: FecR domain-containing protein [Tannerella sp.]|jgi:ferric-dicitrate binding protein FerR (iron transport regulator)|nr:FecR domain-containing protein [Tannerella sp.]